MLEGPYNGPGFPRFPDFANDTDAELGEWVRAQTQTIYHPVGLSLIYCNLHFHVYLLTVTHRSGQSGWVPPTREAASIRSFASTVSTACGSVMLQSFPSNFPVTRFVKSSKVVIIGN